MPGSVRRESRGPSVARLPPSHPAFFIRRIQHRLMVAQTLFAFLPLDFGFASLRNLLAARALCSARESTAFLLTGIPSPCLPPGRHPQTWPLLPRILRAPEPPLLWAIAAALGNNSWRHQGVKKHSYVAVWGGLSGKHQWLQPEMLPLFSTRLQAAGPGVRMLLPSLLPAHAGSGWRQPEFLRLSPANGRFGL